MHTNVFEFKIDHFCLKASVFGDGPTALVIGSHNYYPRTFSANLAKNLQMVYADTRGFTTDHKNHTEKDFTLHKITQDIDMIFQSLKKDRVIIIAHSIHVFMALEYTRMFPHHVSHLVLIAQSPITGPKLYKRADQYFEESVCRIRKAFLQSTMQKFIKSKDHSFIERMLAFGPRLWYDYTFDASKLWDDVTINSIGAEIIWGSMFADYDTAQTLKEITCPILLLLGRYDYFNPPHLWEEYRHYASDLTIRIFEKSSHTPQLEEPEDFDKELIKWLIDKSFNKIKG